MAASSHFKSLSLFSTFSLFLFVCNLNLSSAEFGGEGFSVDFIHRDSHLSPLYNPSETRFHRLHNAFKRSVSRYMSISSKLLSMKSSSSSLAASIQSPITSIPGEYLMKLSIGTPGVQTLAIADTGSDLAWTQCKPCDQCFNQNAPFFDPNSSSTFKNLECQSQPCQSLTSSSCSSENTCKYRMSYGDQSFSTGDLATETFTFGSSSGGSVPINNVVFGCGHNDNGNFNETTSGIIGLGGGELSIVNQFKDSIGGKFSYCLVPIYKGPNVSSKINFGNKAVVSGSSVVSTPLITKSPATYYYLTLEKITIGSKSLEYMKRKNINKVSTPLSRKVLAPNSSQKYEGGDAGEGNIIIDSGTTLTMLPSDFYSDLESTLKDAIGAEVTTDSQGLFKFCYKTDNPDNLKLPTITVHFTDASLDLPPSSTFIEAEEGVVCLTMIPADDVAIFGNLSQMNFLIGYDLVNKKVSFQPADCTKQ